MHSPVRAAQSCDAKICSCASTIVDVLTGARCLRASEGAIGGERVGFMPDMKMHSTRKELVPVLAYGTCLMHAQRAARRLILWALNQIIHAQSVLPEAKKLNSTPRI
eukprot:6194356-Pleurochrysis_carterae.AAC.2